MGKSPKDKMISCFYVSFFVLCAFCISGLPQNENVAETEKLEVLSKCAELYGQPVSKENNLFEVNQFYVLAVVFTEDGRLHRLSVDPKYFYERLKPDWKWRRDFQYLDLEQFQSIRAIVDGIRPPGALIAEASPISTVTNMTAWRTHYFENVKFDWGEVLDLRRGENAPLPVRWMKWDFIDKEPKEFKSVDINLPGLVKKKSEIP